MSGPAPREAASRTSGAAIPASVDEFLASLAGHGALGVLLTQSQDEQQRKGYGHTLREIAQQPVTWIETATRMRGLRQLIGESMAGMGAMVLTGSGSSVYAAECVAPCLQHTLAIPVSAVPAGLILTHPESCLPPQGAFLVVSLARSGNSPESRAVVDFLLEERTQARHLFITCNREGALATSYGGSPGVRSIVLDPRTDDRSLVMTSSFTNLVLAGRALGGDPAACEERALGLARAAAGILRNGTSEIERVARGSFSSTVYLGSGCRLGSAREAALKMTEMNAGDVWTCAESYLGLRHGPMSAIRKDTLLVAFLSSDPLVRAYELDLLGELDRKGLGAARVIVGTAVPRELAAKRALAIDAGPLASYADEDLTLLDALVGQLLAFFRCLGAGYHPDSPSKEGVITRVVSGFEIHRRERAR